MSLEILMFPYFVVAKYLHSNAEMMNSLTDENKLECKQKNVRHKEVDYTKIKIHF